MRTSRLILALAVAGLGVSACDQGPVGPDVPVPQFDHAGGANSTPVLEQLKVCKTGPGASFAVSYSGSPSFSLANFTLADGECKHIATSGSPVRATIVETPGTGSELVSIGVVYAGNNVTPENTDVPSNTAAVSFGEKVNSTDTNPSGAVVTFTNRLIPPPETSGRMTGGGGVDHPSSFYITFGMTVHCDITLSNNIEINWPGNKWHLDKPITSAVCTDDPLIIQKPPKAGLDTFVGTATGRLNGVDGYHLDFIFVDGGEPGTKDQVRFLITAPDASVVLDLPLTTLKNGNIQAHEDQPHKK